MVVTDPARCGGWIATPAAACGSRTALLIARSPALAVQGDYAVVSNSKATCIGFASATVRSPRAPSWVGAQISGQPAVADDILGGAAEDGQVGCVTVQSAFRSLGSCVSAAPASLPGPLSFKHPQNSRIRRPVRKG